MSRAEKRAMIAPGHPELSVAQQCDLLGLSRSSFYYRPVNDNASDLALMELIDRQFLETPCYGSRRMTALLRRRGHVVNRKRVRRLMRQMGLAVIWQKPNTSKPNPEHKVYPYLLRNLVIDRPNQVWATDITYLPMPRGFLYLVAIMDWYSRKILSWKLSNTLDADFCVAALEEALACYGRPEIFNSDQGSQFTSTAFTGVLTAAGVKISMDGKGRCIDNVFVERLWRSLKYEDVYLRAYTTGSEARAGISAWLAAYNTTRPHQGLDYRTPDEVYFRHPAGTGLTPSPLSVAA
jgi:putative transposase